MFLTGVIGRAHPKSQLLGIQKGFGCPMFIRNFARNLSPGEIAKISPDIGDGLREPSTQLL
jgi:hypothetical protein